MAKNAMKTFFLLSTAICSMTGALTLGAAAQTTADDDAGTLRTLDEIVVTARKKEESARDVPSALTAVSGEDLEKAGIGSFDQLLSSVPNASQAGGIAGNLQGLISIRGISTLVRYVGLETGVGYYVDGVYVGRPENFNQDLIDIDRVEVLRGPQGAVFGKNTIAGAINIITDVPDNEFRAQAEFSVGNYNLLKARGNIAGPLVEDRLYASLAGSVTTRDGFVENVFPGGEDLDDADLTTFRAKLRITPSEQVEFILSGDLLRDRSNPAFFEVSDVSFIDDPTESTAFTVNSDQPNTLDRDVDGLSLVSNIDFGDATWTTVLGYRESSFDAELDDDKLPVRYFVDAFASETEFVSLESRIAAPLGDRVDVVAGVYYFTQEAGNVSNFALGDFLTGAPGIEPPLDLVSSVDTESISIFANTDFQLSDRLSLEVGGRYLSEEKTAVHDQVDQTGLFGNVFFDINRTDDDFSPTISLSYDLSDSSTGYIRYAEGFKSAGFNTDIISADAGQEVDPEKATSYEVGHKATWLDGALRTNAAVFYTLYEDLQVATITSAAVSLENAAEAEIYGVEFDFLALLGDYIDVTGSVGYLDATYSDFPGCEAGGAITVIPVENCSGNFLNLAPETTAALALDYRRPTGTSLGDFVARADWNYRSEIFFEPQNEERLSGDARSLVNVRAGFSTDRWDALIWADNLLDETYVTFADDRSGIFVNTTEAYGPPQTYGATLRLKF